MTSHNGLLPIPPQKPSDLRKVRTQTPVFRTALSLHRENATLHPQTACIQTIYDQDDGQKETRHDAFRCLCWYEPGPYSAATNWAGFHCPPGHRQPVQPAGPCDRRQPQPPVASAQQLLVRRQENRYPHLRHRRSRDLQTSSQHVCPVVAPSDNVLNKGHSDVNT